MSNTLAVNISSTTYTLNGDSQTIITPANSVATSASGAHSLFLFQSGGSYRYSIGGVDFFQLDGYLLGTLNIDLTTPANSTFTANQTFQ